MEIALQIQENPYLQYFCGLPQIRKKKTGEVIRRQFLHLRIDLTVEGY